MRHQEVTSEHIESVGYSPLNRVLEVTFQNGSTYQYRGVSPIEHKQMMSCPSAGQFLHHNIKPNYDAERVK